MGLFGGNSGETSGYNCQKINDLGTVINNCAQKAASTIVDRLHDEIIIPISTAWYAPEAIDFFSGFKSTVLGSGENIRSAFDAYRLAVQNAGANWAENTGGETPSVAEVQHISMMLNISEIQGKNAAGDVSIDEGQATAIATGLSDVEAGIKSDLETIANDLDAEAAFIGHGQGEALNECFVRISGEIHKIFKYLTDGEESLQGQINKAVQKYQEVSSGISDAFNNTSGE